MRTDELDFELPDDQIAQHPADQRDAARLLVVDRSTGTFEETIFRELPRYLNAGDLLMLNDTRVIRARLRGRKSTGGAVEIFLLRETAPGTWEALMRPSARVKPGASIELDGGLAARAGGVLPEGRRIVHFDRGDIIAALEYAGIIPLPPYIHRDTPDARDADRYQTVYARNSGAVAAPTAGLHYTPAVFDALDERGVDRAHITLHVGYGTFKPITADALEDHVVDPEDFAVSEAASQAFQRARAAGGRIVAVGTTVTRVLESQVRDGSLPAGAGTTDHYIYPPYVFRAVDALQTNFHLPRSSLLALVCAFGGTDLIRAAYRHAVDAGFRFYSYGDTMLIL